MTLEKFKASNEAIEQAIRALEMDMRSGARSVRYWVNTVQNINCDLVSLTEVFVAIIKSCGIPGLEK